MDASHDEAAERKVFDLIKDIQVAQMVTTDRQGKLRSRPMVAVARQEAYKGGELWFFTSAASGKLDELRANSEVLLAYSDPSRQNYVSVEGDGEVMRDEGKARELWSEPMRVWFPKGPADQDLALVRVKMREANYWDAPASAFVMAYGYAKAIATGERPHPGDVGHVDMRSGA